MRKATKGVWYAELAPYVEPWYVEPAPYVELWYRWQYCSSTAPTTAMRKGYEESLVCGAGSLCRTLVVCGAGSVCRNLVCGAGSVCRTLVCGAVSVCRTLVLYSEYMYKEGPLHDLFSLSNIE
jgi:hypothetical protein